MVKTNNCVTQSVAVIDITDRVGDDLVPLLKDIGEQLKALKSAGTKQLYLPEKKKAVALFSKEMKHTRKNDKYFYAAASFLMMALLPIEIALTPAQFHDWMFASFEQIGEGMSDNLPIFFELCFGGVFGSPVRFHMLYRNDMYSALCC